MIVPVTQGLVRHLHDLAVLAGSWWKTKGSPTTIGSPPLTAFGNAGRSQLGLTRD
ncbi:MAG: hypothetical protein JWO64_3671, partial [Hyphomicrobiales bacterium]|nr:hypothetical protein [Hyphomicrobiales bacterium]